MVAELERDLRAVRVDWPEVPDLPSRVRARLAEPAGFGFAWRRPLVVALAVLVVAIAAAFAVPPARTAILRWLGLHHVRVVHVDRLPPTRKLATADLGRRVTYRAAARAAGFEPLLLRERPDAVFVSRQLGAVRVTFVYGDVSAPRLTLSEFRGFGVTKFVEKLAEPGTKVERVQVDGSPGLFLSGKPHAVYYSLSTNPYNVFFEQPILAGNTLVWERRDGLTVRLEGDLDKDDALRLAKSLR
jgi:hypothetical protein